MRDLAEFVKVSAGTVKKAGMGTEWMNASVGDKLRNGYESDNTDRNCYIIKLFTNAEMVFGSTTGVILENVRGAVMFRNSDNDSWKPVSSDCAVSAIAVATKENGRVSIICSVRGVFRPPEWKPV